MTMPLSPTRAGRTRILVPALLAILCSCGGSPSGSLPSQVSRFPDDLTNPKLEVLGIYQDGWVDKTGSVKLQQPAGEQALSFRGTVPKIGDADFHTDVELKVNDKGIAHQSVGIGDFQIAVPVGTGAGERRVTVAFSAAQQLPAGDGRMVGARVKFIGFVSAASMAAPTAHDIVRGSEIRLGSGWGVVETFRAETFRWVDNDAQILITPQKTGDFALSLAVEAGPGVGGQPFLLKALDESGRQVAAVRVEGRGTVKLFVPVESGKPNEFRLHVDGGGRPAKDDPRILNFRIFQIAVEL
jgi:hypothetical protein